MKWTDLLTAQMELCVSSVTQNLNDLKRIEKKATDKHWLATVDGCRLSVFRINVN